MRRFYPLHLLLTVLILAFAWAALPALVAVIITVIVLFSFLGYA